MMGAFTFTPSIGVNIALISNAEKLLKEEPMKITGLAILVAALLFGSVGSAGADTLLYEGLYGGHEYKLFYVSGLSWNELSWDQASTNVNAMGAGWHLATITSLGENSFVSSLLLNGDPVKHISEAWIGGYQNPLNTTDAALNWTWVTGETFGYTNWNGFEPNDFMGPGTEQYLTMYFDGTWNDSAGTLTGYVAERNTPVPIPGAVWLLGSGIVGLIGLRRRMRK